jgi:ubiquinone/menaquinone biosynthesis C-methylase UbiE
MSPFVDPVLDLLHVRFVGDRRVATLARQIAELLPPGASVLDVGCGDGLLTSKVAAHRPDCTFRGIDVLARPRSFVPVELFDGQHIPLADASVDAVMFVDVLHHTDDPNVLLKEARRVARRCVIIKDHRRDGLLAGPTLRVMDWVGNARHGVRLPYNYLSEREWRGAFAAAGLTPDVWRQRLGIHSALLDPVVGRGLHFLARLS